MGRMNNEKPASHRLHSNNRLIFVLFAEHEINKKNRKKKSTIENDDEDNNKRRWNMYDSLAVERRKIDHNSVCKQNKQFQHF